MKVLIFVSCVFAVASAQWQGHAQAPAPAYNQAAYNGPQHIPKIENGVPVETPEVLAAKANHYAAISDAVNHPAYQHSPQDNGQYNANQANQAYQQQPRYTAPVQQYQPQPQYQPQQQQYQPQPQYQAQQYQAQPQQYSAPAAYQGGQARQFVPAYDTTNVNPGVGRDGKPLDTPEVEAAKAHHFALVSEALARATPQQAQQHYRQRRGIYSAYPQHIPVIGHNGVPVEPLEVQHARAAHLAAHAVSHQQVYSHPEVYSHGAAHFAHDVAHVYSPAPVYHHQQHYVPSFDHEGHPVDTPEVQHAKAAHFAAHAEALARNTPHHHY